MYQEDKDDTTRVGLWITFGIVALVIISTVSAMVVRQLQGVAAAAPAAEAAVAAPVAVVVEEIVLVEGPLQGELLATLYFAVAESALPAEAAAELDKVVQAMAASPARTLVLSGFHDDTGDAAVNAELAKQRALSARAALVAGGVDAGRLTLRKPEVTTGSGPDQQARRVELRLVD